MEEILPEALPETRKRVCISVKDGFVCVDEDEIIYIEASHNYCCVYLSGKPTCPSAQVNIESVMDILKSPFFCRIHRSYIIHVGTITFINTRKTRVHINGKIFLPVGRSYLPELLTKLRLLKK